MSSDGKQRPILKKQSKKPLTGINELSDNFEMVKVSDYVFSFLAGKGVKYAFMLPGGGAMHLVDSLGRSQEIQYFCPRHEQAAAIAAEGYYRTSNKVAAVVVTTGPGGTNTLTGVIGQWLDSIPCIYISG